MIIEAEKTTAAAIEGAKHAREQAAQAGLANEFAKAEAERQFDAYLYVSEATYGPMPEKWAGPVSESDYWVVVTIKNGSNWPVFVRRTANQSFAFRDGEWAGGGGAGGHGVTYELKPGDVTTLEFGGDGPGDPPEVQLYFGFRIEYDTVDGRRRHKDFWLRKAHEYGPPGGWWLDRLDDIPKIVADLPDSYKGPWGSTGYRPPTEEDWEEQRQYHERHRRHRLGAFDT
jgi:hypothetical protein